MWSVTQLHRPFPVWRQSFPAKESLTSHPCSSLFRLCKWKYCVIHKRVTEVCLKTSLARPLCRWRWLLQRSHDAVHAVPWAAALQHIYWPVKQMSQKTRIRLIVLSTVRPLLGSSEHRASTYGLMWVKFVATCVLLWSGCCWIMTKCVHTNTHTVFHTSRAHMRGKKTQKNQAIALRQLAEGQPAKGVGERHIYRERVKGRKVLT